MSKDLFKWTPLTQDLKNSSNPKRSIKKRPVSNVEAWLNHQEPAPKEQDEDEIDIWLNKVRKAADIAKCDVVNDHHDEEGDSNVSSLFNKIIADYIPDYEQESSTTPFKSPDTLQLDSSSLDDKYDTVSEARSILDSWLKKKDEINSEEPFWDRDFDVGPSSRTVSLPTCETPRSELSATLSYLRSVPVEKTVLRKIKKKNKVKNPVLSMAARQEQARERRQKQEEERLTKLKEAAERKAARADAERALQDEASRRIREEKLEEEKIQNEMVALRRKLREEQQIKLVEYEKKVEKQTTEHHAELAAEYRQVVMRNAQQEVERKRILSTRHVLLKQLQEAEKREMRERYTNLQRSFTTWRERTLDSRVMSNKAVALFEWKTQLRAWRFWRGFCKREQDKRDEKIREALFRENKNLRIAELHHKRSYLSYYFDYWKCWTQTRIEEKRERMDEIHRKHLMEKCLAAAAGNFEEETVGENSQTNEIYDSTRYQKRKKVGINFAARKRKHEDLKIKVEKELLENERPVSNKDKHDIEDIVKPINTNNSPAEGRKEIMTKPAVSINPWDSPTIPKSFPAFPMVEIKKNKTPVALRGMEERARQRALKREEIEARKEEKRRQAELGKIEEAKRKAEAEEKLRQVEKDKRLKEIEIAREKEKLRLAGIQSMKEKTLKAVNHYHKYLVLKYGVRPLKKICEKKQLDVRIAEDHFNSVKLKFYWKSWKLNLEIRQLEKEERAAQFYRNLLMRQAFRLLKQSHNLQESYSRIAARHFKRTLKKRVLTSWHRTTRQSDEIRNELEITAIEMDRRSTLRNHLLSWRRLTPILVRERESEARKARMRNFISDLLPDYTPP